MNTARRSNDLAFSLRFYEQSQDAIDRVVDVAVKAHPRIAGWSQTEDADPARQCTVVTLRFNDRSSLNEFRNDQGFVEIYLANAWSRQSLSRGALRVKPSIGYERGTIPSDMFAQVGI